MENLIKMDDLGVPLFKETSICSAICFFVQLSSHCSVPTGYDVQIQSCSPYLLPNPEFSDSGFLFPSAKKKGKGEQAKGEPSKPNTIFAPFLS